MSYFQAVLLTVALSGISVIADYFLKRASAEPDWFRSVHLYAGMLIYAVMCIGWVFVLRHIKLASVGAIYSVVLVILLAIVGVAVFKETLSLPEYIGLACAIAALVLLGGSGSL